MKKRLGSMGHAVPVSLPPLAKGLYLVIVEDGKNSSKHKIVVE